MPRKIYRNDEGLSDFETVDILKAMSRICKRNRVDDRDFISTVSYLQQKEMGAEPKAPIYPKAEETLAAFERVFKRYQMSANNRIGFFTFAKVYLTNIKVGIPKKAFVPAVLAPICPVKA